MKRTCVIALVILIAVAGVYGTARLRETDWQRGESRAKDDWKMGQAILFTDEDIEYCHQGVRIRHEYDRETGLQVRHKSHNHGEFYDGYNSAIANLLKVKGIPSWSAREYILADKELIAALESSDLKKISMFPAEVTDSIVIVNGGQFSRWGYVSSGGGIRIEARRGGTFCEGEDETVYVGRCKTNPQLVFIRIGNSVGTGLCVFHEDGRLLSSCQKEDEGRAPQKESK